MSFAKLTIVILFFVICNIQVLGQKAKAVSNQERISQQLRAVQLLNEILQEAEQLEEKFRKDGTLLFLKPRIADLLWVHDQAKARQLFIDTFNAKVKIPEPELRIRLRSELISYLLPHDPVLAEELATSVINLIHQNNEEYNGSQMNGLRQQATLLLQIADATESPEHSAVLIKSSFNGWLSPNHIASLQKLRLKSPKSTDELFLHAISVVQRKPTHISNKISILAEYVFPSLKNEQVGQQQSADTKMISLFLNFVYDSLVSRSVSVQANEDDEFSTSSFDYLAMQNLIPYFEKYQPNKTKDFSTRIDEITTKVKQQNRKSGYDSERDAYLEIARQDVSELVARAKKENNKSVRQSLYLKALDSLTLQGKLDVAISLFESVKDDLSWKPINFPILFSMAAGYAYENGKLDEAYEYSKNILDVDDRSRLLLELVKKRIKEGELEKAKNMLEEIKQGTLKSDNEWAKLRIISEVAVIETKLNSSQGFKYLESVINILNQSEAERKLGGEVGIGYGPNGIHPPMADYDLGEALSIMVEKDFSRTVAVANKIKDKERSIWAKLAICKTVLSPSQESTVR